MTTVIKFILIAFLTMMPQSNILNGSLQSFGSNGIMDFTQEVYLLVVCIKYQKNFGFLRFLRLV